MSAGNLRGYSPQFLAMQNQLNLRRPPGAPPLVETGKLDYATLSYPAYGMDFDVRNLEARLRQDRTLASARLKRRAELAAKARAARDAFLAAAQKSRDPNAVSKSLLIELGQKQKEAARWIAAAALEEELSRIDELEDFLTPALLAAIDAVPAPAPVRENYKRRAAALKARAARVKATAEKALALLEGDAWAASLAAVDRLVAENRGLKRTLGRDIDLISKVPLRVADSLLRRPSWREWIDDLAVKWAPRLAYSRGVARRRGRLARDLGVFSVVASGDFEAARAAFAASEPGRR